MNVVRLLILLCLMMMPVAAEEIPGSYRIEYGGPYKIVVGYTSALLEARWLDCADLLYQNDDIAYHDLLRREQDIKLTIREWEHGTPWYYRDWWHSLPEKSGGVPKHQKTVFKGKTKMFLDLGLVYFTTAAEARWRGVEMSIDFNKTSPITLGVGRRLNSPSSGWKFRFYPGLKISTSKLITQPLKSIRRADINVGGMYFIRGVDILALVLNVWYSLEQHDWLIGIQIKLVRW